MTKDRYTKEHEYLQAKKRVKKIKDFYSHLMVYIIINIGISGVIVWGLVRSDSYDLIEALTHFGTYSTWLFWGIGVFFHWLSVFGLNVSFLGKDWESRKIKEFMDEDDQRAKKYK